MAEDDTPSPSSSGEKPFFAIDAKDVSEASGESTVPPTPQMVGSLGANNTATSAPTNAWGAPTPQLTGDITTMSGQQVFVTPQPSNNEGFRWGQFFFGLFVPFAVFGVVSILAAALEPEWEDPWRYETVRAESEDAVNYSVQVSPTEYERFESAFGLIEHEGHTIYINVWNEYDSMTSTIYQTNESNYRSDDTNIGTYHVANQTMVFALEDASAEFISIELSYIDERFEYQENPVGMAFCLLPVIHLIATITAFVKGKRSLGWGLVTSAFVGVVLIPLLFFLLLALAFGAF